MVQLPVGTACVSTVDVITTQLSFPLTSDILKVTVSQVGRAPEVMVSIIQAPQHGAIKSQNMTEISPFAYSKIQSGTVTYTLLSSDVRATQDSLQLQFTIGHGASEVVTVPVCILPLPYPSLSPPGVLSVATMGESVIGSDVLAATHDRPVPNGAAALRYDVVDVPRHGIIGNMHTGEEPVATFTQADVDNGHIVYENTREVSVSDLTDSFTVRLSNEYHQLNGTHLVQILLHVADLETINEGIVVTEGETHIITPLELFAAGPQGYDVTMYILQQPTQGDLILQRPHPAPAVPHIRYVELSDIAAGHIQYRHDINTEHPLDTFHFIVIATSVDDRYKEFTSKFNITVNLTNDNVPVASVLTRLSVLQGSREAITTNYLKFTDDDYGFNDDNLIYELQYGPFFGYICIVNASCSLKTGFFTWTQGDIVNRRLIYRNSGTVTNDIFLFTVTDGELSSESELFSIDVIELMANRTMDLPLATLEGGTVPITFFNLFYEANKRGISDASFVYRVTVPPTHGRLESAFGGSVEEFTQQDILFGSIYYKHNGANNLADSFEFIVVLDTFTSNIDSLSITIEPVDDDLPRLQRHRNHLFIEVGDLVHLDQEMLLITDTDTPQPGSLTYTVTGATRYGILEKRASPATNVYTNATTFTQQDVLDMNVRYQHRATPKLLDSFTFTISDGINSPPGNYTVDIVILGETEVTIHRPLIHEGTEAAINRSSIEIHHPYFATASVLFDITQFPRHGSLLHGRPCGQSCPTFTSDDLDQGLVRYVHDGTESTTDEFEFRIELTDTRSTRLFTYPITIVPVNDHKPLIKNNSGLSVWASQTTPITSHHLLATDVDTPPDEILYHFDLTPAEISDGYFASVGSLNVSKTEFVQEEINNGSLVFVDKHDYDGMRYLHFTVTDRNFFKNGTFVISATVFKMQRLDNQELHVEMGGAVKLNLKTFTNAQAQDPPVVFNVTDPPIYGRLVDSDGNNVEAFRQSDVESLQYMHTAVDVWESVDYINVTAHHPYLLQPQQMSMVVSIALLVNKHSPFVSLQNVTLRENAHHCILQTNLDARNVRYNVWKENSAIEGGSFAETQLEYRVVSPPLHGSITVNNTDATTFAHSDILAGSVCYHNNGDEADSDSVVVEARVSDPHGLISMVSDTLPIMIELYNDERPVLLSTPAQLRQEFVIGFPLVLNLVVSDKDSSPSEIVYTITNQSSVGSVTLNGATTSSFTQVNIADEFVQFTPTAVGDSSFKFQYSDPDFISEEIEFFVSVHDHYLQSLVSSQPLVYLQTQTETVISKAILNVSTNGNRNETEFVVTNGPFHGEILLAGEKVTSFNQQQVDLGLVVYRQTDNNYHSDTLTLSMSNRMRIVPNITLNTLVEITGSTSDDQHLPPLMSQPLPAGVIDLSDLKKYSFRQPVIELTSGLKYGYLSYRYPNRDPSTTPITSFDYRDLQNQHVYYTWIPDLGIDTSVNYTEVFTGLVKIDGKPPGVFRFSITLQPPALAVLTSESSTVIQPSNNPTAQGSNGSAPSIFNYFYPVIGLLGVMIVAALGFIVFFCSTKSKPKRIKDKLLQKTGLDFTSKKHPSSRGPSPRTSPPTRTFHSSPINAADLDANSMDSESSSAADIMMMHTNQQTQQVMTISANHTQFPHTGHSSSGYYTQGPVTPYSDVDSYCTSPTPYQQQQGLQDSRWISLSPTRMDGQMHFARGSGPDARATSPVRRSNNFKSNDRPYNSLSTVSGGLPAVPKGLRDYQLRSRDHIKDSVSSLGYESSTQDSVSQRHSVVSSPPPPAAAGPSANNESPDGIDTVQTAPPILKDCEYWV